MRYDRNRIFRTRRKPFHKFNAASRHRIVWLTLLGPQFVRFRLVTKTFKVDPIVGVVINGFHFGNNGLLVATLVTCKLAPTLRTEIVDNKLRTLTCKHNVCGLQGARKRAHDDHFGLDIMELFPADLLALLDPSVRQLGVLVVPGVLCSERHGCIIAIAAIHLVMESLGVPDKVDRLGALCQKQTKAVLGNMRECRTLVRNVW
mmetsp:Transcript_25155/g.54923  ORF Transcript_25155/g.54923 Transcript_25155/m.54923 type:complete len:203 (-) Transcript_25155:195-803(-)